MKRVKHIILSYFITYIVVALPLLGIGFGIARLNEKRIERNEEQIMQGQLDMLAEDMVNWFQNHFENSVILARDEKFGSKYVLKDSGRAAETIAFLHKIKMFDAGVTDIFIYYGEGALYSAGGKSRPSTYFRDTLSCMEDMVVRAEEFIRASEAGVMLIQTKQTESYLLYHFPASESHYGQYYAINYLVSVPYWKEQARTIFEGTPITLYLNVGTDSVALIENLEEKGSLITLQSENDVNGMNLVLTYDSNAAHLEMRELQKLNSYLLLIGMFLSMIISLGMSHRDNKRIKQYSQMVQNKEIIPSSPKGFLSNFDYVQELFEQLLKENIQINNEMQSAKQIILTQIAKMLFNGLLKDDYTIRLMLKNFGREMFEEYYCIYCLQFDSSEEAEAYSKIINEPLYEMMAFEKGMTIIYLEELPMLDPLGQQRKERALHVMKAVNNGQKIKFIGISQVYQELSMAHYAVLEVISLLERSTVLKDEIMCWDSLGGNPYEKVIVMPKELLDNLSIALEKQSLENARQALKKIQKFIYNTNVSAEIKRYYRYCILQEVITAFCNEEREDLQHILDELLRKNIVDSDEFYKRIEFFLQKICNQSGLDYQFTKAIAHVEANYSRYDLSLEEVAEVAGISKTHMSKLFKNRIGIRYIDYLSKLRMERARFLLEESELSIKEIMLEVGYVDKTNFSKKFKEYFGINASSYRKQTKEPK